jgi:hypothetical protein
MQHKIILILSAIIISLTVVAQGERKLDKNFSFVITEKLDTIASFSIDTRVKRSGWGEFYGAFTQALIAKGFSVINKESLSSIHSYSIIIDYGRGFFAGKMQYFDLRGQIININKNSEVLGTFSYDGRFNPDEISVAIASTLKNKNPVIVKEEQKKPEIIKNEPPSNQSGKSKEERLKELKNLFEKDLITKEEYEKAKQKILEEQ